MLLRYFYDEKLAHASYLVGCQATGDALVIDPGRNINEYIATAEREGLQIVSVTETHIHADFVSGLLELATRTGATAYLSDEGDENWKYQFADRINSVLIKDGDQWNVGNLRIQVMHSPGHTPEHVSFFLTDGAAADEPMGIFTGDFVFVGDVGRPDLLEEAAGIAATKEPSARTLYRSLQRFAELPDYLQIWPAHGAGSACGKALGAVPSSTVGYEKRFNWAFRTESEDEFVRMVLEGQPEPPRYFAMMKKLNKIGPPLLNGQSIPPRLTAHRMAELVQQEAIIVDTRDASAFAEEHLPGSWNIPLSSSFVTYAGWLLDYTTPFYLIVDDAQVTVATQLLQSIGLDNVAGYATPESLEFWTRETSQELPVITQVTPRQIKDAVLQKDVLIIDVRSAAEFSEGHLPNAVNIPLGFVLERVSELPAHHPVLVNCQTGVRSAIAASLLQGAGLTQVMNLRGGYVEWITEQLPVDRESNIGQSVALKS
jgi:hydroxyacylglutathione hydrolase